MRIVGTRDRRCERAREWISLGLDGELSPFEQRLLDSHCRVFEEDVHAISRRLREAPLERLERPIVLPRRPLFAGRAFQFAVAGAAAVAVAVGSTFGVMTADRSTRDKFGSKVRPAYLDSPDYELRMIHKAQEVRLLAALTHAN
jgi:ferric-dicitrate binding protein FerR (iron transport regulator)